MKISFLYLVLVAATIVSNQNLFCASKDLTRRSKGEIDAIAKSSSKRDLVRTNLELRQKLAARKTGYDPEAATDELVPAASTLAGAGTSLDLRTRTRSDSSAVLAGSVDDLHGTVADFLALQNTQLQRQKAADDERDKFQKQVYKDIRYARKTAILGSLAAVTYTTIGFVWQNWPALSKALGLNHTSDSSSSSSSSSSGY
jgi:hypothetical protein